MIEKFYYYDEIPLSITLDINNLTDIKGDKVKEVKLIGDDVEVVVEVEVDDYYCGCYSYLQTHKLFRTKERLIDYIGEIYQKTIDSINDKMRRELEYLKTIS
jgi:hypothetical protein